jgi:glycosyltransferase involved in cell wall biosynthesis
MKIALLSYEYPPETGFGGIGTYTWHHARALAKLGHDVHVLAGATEPTSLRACEHDGVRVYRYRPNGRAMAGLEILGSLRLWWTRQRLQNALGMYQALRQLLREERYDIVEMPECGAEGALVTKRLAVPTVVRLHSPACLIMPYYDVRRADTVLCAAVEQVALRHGTTLSACSRFMANEARDQLGVQRPIEVISNGIDLEWFDGQDESTGPPTLPRDRLTILFSGRMERRKGIHLCGEIASAILGRFDVALAFAGDDLFGHLERDVLPRVRAAHLKGSFHRLGRLGLCEMRACLRRADIVLMPSLWGNCPYSCLEAMAAGRAIVASRQGGLPELIHDGETGLLAEPGDAGSFIDAIERLVHDSCLRARLGRAARRAVEQSHHHVQIARQSVGLYRDCLAGRS